MAQPLKYMTIRGNLLALVADMAIGDEIGAPDDQPDERNLTGDVTFTFNTLANGELLSAPLHPDGPRSFAVRPIKAKIVDGELTDLVGRPYVKLVAPDVFTDPVKGAYFVSFTNVRYGNESILINGWAFEAVPGDDKSLTEVRKAPNTTGAGVTRGASIASVEAVLGQFVITLDNGIVLPPVSFPDYLTLLSSAATFAGIAGDAADAALASQTTASSAATSAASSKAAAGVSETNAAASATSANNSKIAAATSASNAATSESNANTSKNAAAGSAAAAATSATNAGTSETNANTSKNAAAGSATAAGTSATNAGNSATAAQTARTAAETARTGAEQARDAATSMVVPDSAVTRPKLKTADHTNLLFGAGIEGGIEAQDWPTNTYGANLSVDTTTVWDGTRSLKVAGSGTLQSVEIPTSPGEVFIFSAMQYVPVVVTGSGGLRMQWMDGAGVWADIATATVSHEASTLVAATWTRGSIIGTMPAGARRVRIRLAHANTNYASGIFYDNLDWRRIQDTYAPQSILASHIGNGQVSGTQLANGAVTAGKIVDGGVDTYARVAQVAAEQIAAQSVIFHDMLPFLSSITATQEATSDAGANWSGTALVSNLFNNREGEFTTIGTAATGQGMRLTFVGTTTPISNVTAKFLQISFGYTTVAPNRTVTVESSPDGTTWTSRFSQTGVTTNAGTWVVPITDWGSHTRVRITVLNTTASGMNIGAVRLLVARPGGEGRATENKYPFSWDAGKNVTFPAGVKLAGAGTPAAGRLLISDGSGQATWQDLTASLIPDGIVGTAELATDAVTNVKMATNSVGSDEIVDGSVGTAELATDAVTNVKMATNSVGADEIIDGSVGNAEIASNAAIALSKLAAGYVQGQRNGTATTTQIDILTEAQFQALVTAGTVQGSTVYLRTA